MNDQLYHACKRGDDKSLQKLLVKRRKNALDKPNRAEGGMTPLHAAACSGQAGCVRMLLDARAAVNITDDAGLTPLYQAAFYDHSEVVTLLLSASAAVNHVGPLRKEAKRCECWAACCCRKH